MNTDKMTNLLDDLKQLKDELTLKANLGKAEAEDELAKLEPVYEDIKDKIERLSDVAGDTSSELKTAAELGIDANSKEELNTVLKLSVEELKDAYNNFKKILS